VVRGLGGRQEARVPLEVLRTTRVFGTADG